jgi:8-oxo-dGTP pyrophosphatase MutT (NUDIX family)/phosphohistidine phosphatase SixA
MADEDTAAADEDPDHEVAAAGAIVHRLTDQREIGLIHRIKYGDWTFPKGKVEPGEHVVSAAVREVGEETGIGVVLGRRLSRVRYHSLAQHHPKRVDYWAAQAAPGSGTDFVPNDEVDGMTWLPVPQARERLSYAHDAELLDEFADGPAETTPLILVRHASAGSKHEWRGDDTGRPLDAKGRADAGHLAGLLASFGRSRVISSVARRCLATVEPYAARCSQPISVDPALSVGANEELVAALAIRIATEAVPTVLCAHRENLAPLLAGVCAALGAGRPPLHKLEKGGFWVLQLAGGTLASTEQHHAAVAGA